MSDSKQLEKYRRQADMLANRVRKRYQHLRKRFARQQIDVFRLFDRDIPEIRAAVDWYAGHLVVAEYLRRQSTPDWLPMMGVAAAEALGVPPEHLHLKLRRSGRQDGKRYERIDTTDRKIIVRERDLRFYVNLDDFVDTGLFADHRDTRLMVRDMAAGRDFLNLFCYTGSFTCYAAKGGARSTASVDRSESAIAWTRDNLALNGIAAESHALAQSHAADFLEAARRLGTRFDLAVVDPPSYSTTRNQGDEFDVLKDHAALLAQVVEVMRKGATIFFSTNHQNFEPRFEALAIDSAAEITEETLPEDYRCKHKRIHRCWRMIV
jgi:23S rRNA (cytosine1962-C5)-methyltransferase